MLERERGELALTRRCAPAAAGPARGAQPRLAGARAAAGSRSPTTTARRTAGWLDGRARGGAGEPGGDRPGPDDCRSRASATGSGPFARTRSIDGARALVRDLQHRLRGRAARAPRTASTRRSPRRWARTPTSAGGRSGSAPATSGPTRRPVHHAVDELGAAGTVRAALRRQRLGARLRPPPRAARAHPALGCRPQPEPAAARAWRSPAWRSPAAAGRRRCSRSPTARDLAAALPALRRRPARGARSTSPPTSRPPGPRCAARLRHRRLVL